MREDAANVEPADMQAVLQFMSEHITWAFAQMFWPTLRYVDFAKIDLRIFGDKGPERGKHVQTTSVATYI
jgi:hypothetical protein